MTHNILINSDYGPIIGNINDSVILKSIQKTGYWAKDDIQLINQLINFKLKFQDCVTFYDIGANIGTHTLALAVTHGSKIKIRAFEAQRLIFYMLCGSVALHGLDNCYLYNKAVGDGSLSFLNIQLPDYNQPNNFGGVELVQPIRSDNQTMHMGAYETVEMVNVDYYDERVDFIKIDVEGMEDKVIKGALLTLKRWNPFVFCEILKTDVTFVINEFKSLGYSGYQKNADLIAIPSKYSITIEGLKRIF